MKRRIIWPVLFSIWALILFIIAEALIFSSSLPQVANPDGMIGRIIGAAIIISGLLYFVLSRTIHQVTYPIKELQQDARHFNEDEYIHQLRNYEIEELDELAHAFDYMGEELSSTIRKLKYQKAKRETILGALDEGIIVINKQGMIKEANDLACKLLHLQNPVQKKSQITHILRDEKFINLIEKGLKGSGHEIIEVQLSEQTFYVTMVPVGQINEAVEFLLVIKDVTELRALEEMRYQFVTNVSHELKTPLTSIQGFVETLQSGAIENKEIALKFLNIIDIEAKRLYRLIQDILLLSEIENMEERKYPDVELQSVVSEVTMLLEGAAKKKGLEVVYKLEEPILLHNISRDHLQQLLMNLVSNGIRYTDKGRIQILARQEEDTVYISVEDTGIGIPEESISHIFTRFYRVDRGRSRQNGGTGLGLSIVKHIAQLYKIKVEVESEVGIGSKFTLIFKNVEDSK